MTETPRTPTSFRDAPACRAIDAGARPITDFDAERRGDPVLIYDGDCGFCAWWARYWQDLVSVRVRFAPYQEVARHFPAIAQDAFRGAVQYVAPNGSAAGGAEAVFLTLAHAPGHGRGLWAYKHLPGFAAAAEAAYRLIAAHRPLFGVLTRLLWGPRPLVQRHELTAGLFLRLLGLVYLAAFLSLGSQVLGLIGSSGILPAADYFAAAARSEGALAWLAHPSLFWISSGDWVLQAACWAGAAVALAIVANRFAGPALLIAWLLYLSLYHAGQVFLDYQWDLLLLEAGFLGWLLTSGSRVPLWLLRWLLLRFMFLAGAVKLASGDPSWASLRALQYHLETQPLPTPLAWYAFQLPADLLAALTAGHFFVELALPFLVFLPRRPRIAAAAGFFVLQMLILATGNFGFFNLLTLVLLVPLLDDALLRRCIPPRAAAWIGLRSGGWVGPVRTTFLVGFAVLAIGLGAAQIGRRLALDPEHAVFPALAPLRLVNSYGVFANMVKDRREIVLEGSDDGLHWREIPFRFRPGRPETGPSWNIPHHPRLDWQIWFAALGDPRESPWLEPFLARLLAGSPEVWALLGPAAAPPPRQIRATLYRYRYATPEERARGLWWQREPEGAFLPSVTALTVRGLARRAATPESSIRWR